jgi:hypothetical protein
MSTGYKSLETRHNSSLYLSISILTPHVHYIRITTNPIKIAGLKQTTRQSLPLSSRIWRVLTLESPSFWALSIVRNSKYQKTQCFGNWICFHPQVRGGRHLLCWVPRKELNSY